MARRKNVAQPLAEGPATLKERSTAFKVFIKDAKIPAATIASMAKLTPSMLSRFENGLQDLTPEAYARLQKAMLVVVSGKWEEELMERLEKLRDSEAVKILLPKHSFLPAVYLRDLGKPVARVHRVVVDFGKKIDSYEERHAQDRSEIEALRNELKTIRDHLAEWMELKTTAALAESKAEELRGNAQQLIEKERNDK